MKMTTRIFLLIACLMLPLAACKKEDAPKAVVKAPMTAPATDDRQAWMDYLSDVVNRNMDGISNQPFVYMLPAESVPDFQDQYDRLLEKASSDIGSGIVSGNLLAYGSSTSAKMADMVVSAFGGVEPNTMKGVKVLFIGDAADNQRVKTAVTPAGVNYVFVEAK